MAVTASGLFVATFIDVLDATQLAIDLSLATHKLALFSNSITPDFDASAANAAYGAGQYASNEVSGTGWAAGGVALSAAAAGATSTSPTLTGATGTMTYDMGDVAVSGTTLTSARCALLYADALAGNNAIVLVNFGADYSTSNGIFGITWAAGGVFSVDWTP
ncbi:hypothetical protein BBK14_11210 [Parafrankia soli]|uniref:Uncharacterized protein n=1 Tax=Parafrankia soli TaxID=2599596 RepID=A0A1S1R5G6_9ACTN|nr:hypothetical protein [Parafrankia soli]OHV42183.1 hypothetical protein BBK14_11210 [Parafrankia soli]